jgi:hypothetical protein
MCPISLLQNFKRNQMAKTYLSAPLPFVGQKRMFASRFIDIVSQYPDGAVFIDLLGGSGLLSHIAKRCHPGARVIYNDFDNYRQRIDNIPRTNELLKQIRDIVSGLPRHKAIKGDPRDKILALLEAEEATSGYVDYITLSASLLFSGKYRTSLEGMRKETFYNTVRKSDYDPATDYLDGLEITSCDYKVLVDRFKDAPGVVFLVDPPYLSTDVGTYRMYWGLSDYLDVLSALSGHDFIYFTSNKSQIIELCEWMGRNPSVGNPFAHCKKMEFNAHLNYAAQYTDIMLYTDPTTREVAA